MLRLSLSLLEAEAEVDKEEEDVQGESKKFDSCLFLSVYWWVSTGTVCIFEKNNSFLSLNFKKKQVRIQLKRRLIC